MEMVGRWGRDDRDDRDGSGGSGVYYILYSGLEGVMCGSGVLTVFFCCGVLSGGGVLSGVLSNWVTEGARFSLWFKLVWVWWTGVE